MRKKRELFAALVVVVIALSFLGYFVMGFMAQRSAQLSTPQPATSKLAREEVADSGEGVGVDDAAVVSPIADAVAQDSGADEPAVEPAAVVADIAGDSVLRVILDGVPEEHAAMTRVTLTGVDHRRHHWPSHFRRSWPWQGRAGDGLTSDGLASDGPTSEYDIDPFFASVAAASNWDITIDELEVKVCHSQYLIEKVRVPLSEGVVLKSGQTLYEARVRLVPGAPHEFWPELTLAVRDADTHAHLDNVELRCVPTAFMGLGQVPGGEPLFTSVGAGLSSPIVLRGGRELGESEDRVRGLALATAAGEAPQLFELVQPEETTRGVVVYAGAPGYAWSRIVIDVSSDAERELLLKPAATLDVRMTNVQLQHYDALETRAWLWVDVLRPDGSVGRAWHQRLDEALASEGLWFDTLEAGVYTVSVTLDAGSWKKAPVLAREEFLLAAGETRELVLKLADPPAHPEFATLEGVISFPVLGGPLFDVDEKVRLQLFYQTSGYRDPHVELSVGEMDRVVGRSLLTWAFHIEDLPPGMYQVQLLPFLTNKMIELPADGREEVNLVVPELAEVLVETVDARTGVPVPLEELFYRNREVLPGQFHNHWTKVDVEEPGRFRFWTAPGGKVLWPRNIPSELGYGAQNRALDLVAGPQSARFELEPVYAFRIVFRDSGEELHRFDAIWGELQRVQNFRAVDHDGHVTSLSNKKKQLIEVSVPGVYEVSFEGVGADRFYPIPTQRVDVRAGEAAEVIVDLRRK